MAEEKHISVSFGTFAVDIEGYDDPFAVLSAVISHIKSTSGEPLGAMGFAAGDLENAALLASLSAEAAQIELTGDAENPRLSVKAVTPESEAHVAEAIRAEVLAESLTAIPAAPTADQSDIKDAPQTAETVPEAPATKETVSLNAVAEIPPKTETSIETEEAASEGASIDANAPDEAQDESLAPDAVAAPTTTDVTDATTDDTDGDEEAAILRRVRRAITRVDKTRTAALTLKPKPAALRSPAEQKAEVVKDIATTLRRIGAHPDEAATPTPLTAEAPQSASEKTPSSITAPITAPITAAPTTVTPEAVKQVEPSATHPLSKLTPLVANMSSAKENKPTLHSSATGQLKPKARKPLTMQMQIRPNTLDSSSKTTANDPANALVNGEKPKSVQGADAAHAKITAPDRRTAAPATGDARPTLDREKIRERLVDLAKDDEVIDNFLFDDVAAVVENRAGASAVSTDPATANKDGAGDDETLILTVAEAAPLMLDNSITEPLVLTDPIEPPIATPVAVTAAAHEAAPVMEEETAQADTLTEPTPAQPKVQASKVGTSEEGIPAGFSRLIEVRDTPIPMLLEKGTRPKRRNGDPRLVALSDETQFDKSMSPQDFAAHIGATSLHDLLEATAVYMAIVEGRPNFSRQDIMMAFARIKTAEQYTTEQRLKTFRKLLSSGALTRVDERDYALSHETRFGYETQLRA